MEALGVPALRCSAVQCSADCKGPRVCGSRARIISIISIIIIIMITRRRARPCGEEMALAASGQNSRRRGSDATGRKHMEEAVQNAPT